MNSSLGATRWARPRTLGAAILALVGSTAGIVGVPTAHAASGSDHIVPVAGSAVAGISGDGFAGTAALVKFPVAVTTDSAHDVYIADYYAGQVRRVDASGVITTVAGLGRLGNRREDNGDGGPALLGRLSHPAGVAVDGAGNLYISDTDSHLIRKVDTSGIITTYAGTGAYGDTGDGGPATEAALGYPAGLGTGPAGDLYIVDGGNNKIRRVDSAGIMSTFAGTGDAAFNGDGGRAVDTAIAPSDVTIGPDGVVYIADYDNGRVREVDSSGLIHTVAGTGESGDEGDGGPATEALVYAQEVASDSAGNLYIASLQDSRVRKVDTAGTITTVAGTGDATSTGDGGPAIQAAVHPWDIVADQDGGVVLGEDTRVRRFGPDRLQLAESHQPARPKEGDQVVYSLTVTNLSGSATTGVKVTTTVPAQLSYVSAGGAACSLSGSAVTCSVGAMASGAQTTVTLTMRTRQAALLSEAFHVASNEADPYARDNTDVVATQVSAATCGQVVTSRIVLAADVGPCADNGVVVGADDVVLDLGGHHVYGFPDPSGPASDVAGVVLAGRHGVTVRNGTVSDFDAGLAVLGGGSNTLQGLTLRDNLGANDAFNALFGDGVFVDSSTSNLIQNNTVSDNGIFDGIGIFGADANSNIVRANKVEDTVGPADRGPGGQGIIVNGATAGIAPTTISGTLVESNTVRANGSAGISDVNNIDGVIRGNTITGNGLTNSGGNGIGIQVGPRWRRTDAMNMLVRGNLVQGNGDDGIQVRRSANGNRIIGNTSTGNGIKGAFDLRDLNPGCGTNVWSGNTWGSAGYSPACVTNGGSGSAAAGTAALAEISAAGADLDGAIVARAQFDAQGRRAGGPS